MSPRQRRNQGKSKPKSRGKSHSSGKGGKRGKPPSGGKKTRGRAFSLNAQQKQSREKKVPKNAEVLTGRIQKNPRGFGFILCDKPDIPDTYVPERLAQGLFSKDRVEFTRVADGDRWSARRIRVIERNTTKIVGQVQKDRGRYYIEDNENRLPLKPSKELKQAEGQWAIANIEAFSSNESEGRAALAEIFGDALGPEDDLPLTCARFGLEREFSDKVKYHAEQATMDVESELESRRDMRELPFVTIDGADAKDFDDAILVQKTKQGFQLIVAIADVAHFVQKGSALDREAFARGTSVYFPGVCIPMLPEELSNDLCSLRPREERLTLNCEINYDLAGEVKSSRCFEGIIRTWHRLTYEQVESLHQSNQVPAELSNIETPILDAFELFSVLLEKRRQRGTLDFNLPEAMVDVDKTGTPISVLPRERLQSHKLIEEFMIAANEQVAKVLKAQKVGALYRVHEPPSIEAIDEINDLMMELGIREKLRGRGSMAFSRLLESTESLSNAKTLHKYILRKQKQACYRPDPIGHFGLALKDYCHFTSPIRRYPDLVVHRALKRHLNHQKSQLPTLVDLETAGMQCSSLERRAIDAERFMLKRKFCWFMATKLHQVFNASISSITEFGLYVELEESSIDVLIPPSQLMYRYEFDEEAHCLRRRPGGQTLHIGDPIRVEILESDPENLSIIGRETDANLTAKNASH